MSDRTPSAARGMGSPHADPPGTWRLRAAQLAGAVALITLAAGCAKKESPSGGPPDIDPPRVVSAFPDSGSASVPLDVRPTLTFSEGMEPRSTGEAVSIAPPVEIRQRRWKGKSFTLVFSDSLARDRTYTLFVSGTARDRHGNTYGTGKTVVFSTGAVFPPGSISGRISARGFPAGGTYLWCYNIGLGHAPDSTARDFDGLGLADDDGSFEIAGLAVPGRYRLWAFVDLNGNRSLEPVSDVLAAIDTTFDLTAAAPRASGVLLRVTNPRAPGFVAGSVVDSIADSTGVLHVIAMSASDTTKQVLIEADREGNFELRLDVGTWNVRAFRDLDANRAWQRPRERASASMEIVVEPAGRVTAVVLTLRPQTGGP